MSNVISFEHVSKQYVRKRRRKHDLRELFSGFFSPRVRHEPFWALRDVSFDVEQGQGVGIIGPNGAGKSTALKILARIVRATAGHVHIKGRVTPLIEVGAGFHPDLTGRENVYLNAAVLGLRRSEVRSRFDSIVEFAELAQFIDTPAKRYSTGMLMRLGFAVAAHLNPDILLVDEVLAVGDMAFQRKCLEAIRELRRRGTTILFVSHSMEAVSSLCNRVLLMDHGQIAASGPPDAVITQYRRHVFEEISPSLPPNGRPANTAVEITTVRIEDETGEERRVFATGDTIAVRCDFRCRESIPDAIFYAAIHRADGSICFGTNTFVESNQLYRVQGDGSFRICFSDISLMPGSYLVTVRIGERDMYRYLDSRDLAYGLVIDGSRPGWGTFYMAHSWEVIPADGAHTICGQPRLSREQSSLLPSIGGNALGIQSAQD